MIKLAVENLYDSVRASFIENAINAENVFGWRTPAQYSSELPRCAWVPGDDKSGTLGELGGARNPGQDPRPLAQLGELFTVYLTAADPRDPENELAQYHATRFLYEAWYVALYRAAHGTFRVRSQGWVTSKRERSYGATLRVVCEVQAPIVDALPDEPLVGDTFAGRADTVFVTVPSGHVDLELVTETEAVDIAPPGTPPVDGDDDDPDDDAASGGIQTTSNKLMPCRVTHADGDLACDIAIAKQPAADTFITVIVDDWTVTDIGNATKYACVCFFSGDGGATARAWGAVRQHDTVHWNGSIAGGELDASSVMSIIYEV